MICGWPMVATRKPVMRITQAKLAYYAALPEITRMSKKAMDQAEGAAHVVYVIINPAVPDPLCTFAGMPIYVGMSANIERRVLLHYRRAAFKRLRRGYVSWGINRLLKKGTLVQFVVVGQFESLIETEIAEIHQSQKLVAAGYKLLNMLSAQSIAMSDQQLADMTARRRALFVLRCGAGHDS